MQFDRGFICSLIGGLCMHCGELSKGIIVVLFVYTGLLLTAVVVLTDRDLQ